MGSLKEGYLCTKQLWIHLSTKAIIISTDRLKVHYTHSSINYVLQGSGRYTYPLEFHIVKTLKDPHLTIGVNQEYVILTLPL